MPNVRPKSQPVPRGMTASSTPSVPPSPLTTSFTEPSPPTTTSLRAPLSTASAASVVSCPAASEMRASPSSPRAAARCSISGQRLPVEPPAEAGLPRKTVRPTLVAVVTRRCGVERDARHPVDGGTQLLVGDPDELALDDDVAHRQQAAAMHAAQRGEREQCGGLHLHGEN